MNECPFTAIAIQPSTPRRTIVKAIELDDEAHNGTYFLYDGALHIVTTAAYVNLATGQETSIQPYEEVEVMKSVSITYSRG